MEDCNQLMTGGFGNPGSVDAFQACQRLNYYEALFNEHLEGSAYHMLYEYIIQANQEPATVAAKSVLHKNAVGSFADIAQISRSNFKSWLRTGIMRETANRGGEPTQPEVAISGLKQKAQEGTNT